MLRTWSRRVRCRHQAHCVRGEKHQRLFHTLSQQGRSEFLVVSVARWDEHASMLVIREQKCKEQSQSVTHMSGRISKADLSRTHEIGGKTLKKSNGIVGK